MPDTTLTAAEAAAGFTTDGAASSSSPQYQAPTADFSPPPGLSENATPEEVFKSFTQLPTPKEDAAEQKQAAAPTSESKPVGQADSTAQPNQSDVPEEFLTGKPREEGKPDDLLDGLPFERPKGPITHGHFERVHEQANAKIAAIAQELKLTREQLEETSKKVGVPSEDFTKKLEELRRERDEYSEKLLRQAAQEHPEFQKKYVARQKEITERLNLRAKEMGVPEESIDMALRSSFRRRAEIVEDMDINPTAKAALINMMEQHDAIEGEKGGFLAQSREELTKWQRQQQEAAEAQDRERAAMEERTFAAVAEKMSKTFAPFQKVEGNAAWNAQADALHAEAKKYFNGQVPLESLAEVVHRGLGARVLEEKIIPGLRSQLQSLAAENARLKAAQPGAGGDKPGGARPVEDDSHLTAEQRAQATFRRFQAMGANNGFGQ